MRPTVVSVLIPTYNGETFIAAALESVRGQYNDALEIIVIDDGSSDRTLEIVGDFSKLLPMRVITPGRIGNWVAVSNIGLREARAEWACFLHQDDFWLPGRIATLLPEIEKAKGALVLHDAVYINAQGKNLGPWTCPLSDGDVPPEEFVGRLLVQNFIAIPSPVFRRAAVIDSGGLDEALWYSADWDLWLRLGAMGPVRFIAETLAAFRIHPNSQTSSRRVEAGEWEKQLTTVLERHLRTWRSMVNHSSEKRCKAVERAARASVAVNCALSGASRGGSLRISDTVRTLLPLGPAGWYRYLRDSRILQRVCARRKL